MCEHILVAKCAAYFIWYMYNNHREYKLKPPRIIIIVNMYTIRIIIMCNIC